jgi:hypothetical protein
MQHSLPTPSLIDGSDSVYYSVQKRRSQETPKNLQNQIIVLGYDDM